MKPGGTCGDLTFKKYTVRCQPRVNEQKRKALGDFAKCLTSLVAGARYAQRCPVEFGVPMEVVIAA